MTLEISNASLTSGIESQPLIDQYQLPIVREYVIKGEDSWIMDTKLVNFIGALLEHRSLNPDIRAKLVRLLAAGALRDDFWSFLQMDRKDRHLMKFPQDFENLTVEEQKAVTLFLCNNFSSPKVQNHSVQSYPLISTVNDLI